MEIYIDSKSYRRRESVGARSPAGQLRGERTDPRGSHTRFAHYARTSAGPSAPEVPPRFLPGKFPM